MPTDWPKFEMYTSIRLLRNALDTMTISRLHRFDIRLRIASLSIVRPPSKSRSFTHRSNPMFSHFSISCDANSTSASLYITNASYFLGGKFFSLRSKSAVVKMSLAGSACTISIKLLFVVVSLDCDRKIKASASSAKIRFHNQIN